MRRFVCVHGHFYQPPREDPWSREVEREPSAAPFHDWNERISAECYGPNSASPLFDDRGRIMELVNNYSRMSFDFGPTLLRWLETHYSELYDSILAADSESAKRFGGHGSAMAQVYNHMIMPLASAEDRKTQTRWGVDDFERRFGRHPEGMWLPETAADIPSLEALADADIKFTVLSPRQVSAVREEGGDWRPPSARGFSTRRAYQVRLPSGRSISVFFYDDGISNAIAFGDLLSTGDRLSGALLGGFSGSDEPQLVNVASDGETYGHHHRRGHVALTRALSEVEKTGECSVANYGYFLSLVQPTWEARIVEPSSWSCAHGVERWRSDCGCGSEIKPGYNQKWRSPLRQALDWLRDREMEFYSARSGKYFDDKDEVKERLALSGLGPSGPRERYLEARLRKGHSERDADEARVLLESLECSALMFASCAWFWEDISRPETRQMLRYAARAMEIMRAASGADLSPDFGRILGQAVPNAPGFHQGPMLLAELSRRGPG